MVDDVVVGNIVEEEAAHPAQERPVNGSSSAALEGPFLATVVGELEVGVVEVW